MDVRKSPKYLLEQTKCTDHTLWLCWTAAASRMDGPMQIITCCVRSGAYEQDLQTLEVLRGGGNKWMFGSSKFVKRWKVRQIVHHGVYKNSYSPYGGWYNASTDALVALVPSVLTLFVWWNAGKWPQISEKYEAPKKRPNNGFLLVLYMRSHDDATWGTNIYIIHVCWMWPHT